MTVGDSYSILFTTLIGGGVVGAIITKMYDYWMTKRQERIEMTRLRLDTISKAAPYYSRLAVYNCWNLAWLLGQGANENEDSMFYYLCNVLYLRNKIIKTYGEIQLNDLEAEEIIGNLGREIVNSVNNYFGHLDGSRIQSLVENDIPFHTFHDNLQEDQNKILYQKFVEWLSHKESANELRRTCRWFAELIMLELNHIYQSWYDEPPNLSRLDKELVGYLMTNHPKYYNTILDFRKTFFRAKHSIMIES